MKNFIMKFETTAKITVKRFHQKKRDPIFNCSIRLNSQNGLSAIKVNVKDNSHKKNKVQVCSNRWGDTEKNYCVEFSLKECGIFHIQNDSYYEIFRCITEHMEEILDRHIDIIEQEQK